ncbi:MAG: hypothetical protein IT285_12685, partial [Bdellovibrionales bacterium]|nr:hypothetical protein [Bdellovibrionales bacterium]
HEIFENRPVPEDEFRKALELRGLVFRKSRGLEGAARTYEHLVRRYDPQHYDRVEDVEVLEQRLKADVAAGVKLPEPVLSYYYELGQVLRQRVADGGSDERALFGRGAIHAFLVAEAFNYRKSFAQTALRELRQAEPAPAARVPEPAQPQEELPEPAMKGATLEDRIRWHVALAYATWVEEFSYRGPADDLSKLGFDARAVCLGGGMTLALGRFDLGFSACYLYGLGRVDPARASVPYRRSRVEITGGILGPSAWWRQGRGDVSLGIELPVIYRVANLPLPSEPGAGIPERNNFAFAFLLGMRARIGPARALLRGGWSANFTAPVWSAALELPLGRDPRSGP